MLKNRKPAVQPRKPRTGTVEPVMTRFLDFQNPPFKTQNYTPFLPLPLTLTLTLIGLDLRRSRSHSRTPVSHVQALPRSLPRSHGQALPRSHLYSSTSTAPPSLTPTISRSYGLTSTISHSYGLTESRSHLHGSTSTTPPPRLHLLLTFKSNEEHNAEIVLSVVVVDELVDKLRSFATKHIISKWGFMEELIKLLLSLTKIQVVLHDAEKMQVSDEFVMIWLSELRDVAYDVDDMLDEFHSKILRTKCKQSTNFYSSYSGYARTPKDIGRLTSLQTLPFFTVNPDAGCSLEELGHLNQLSGELDIYNLEHVRDNVEAKSANLAKNAKIYKLGFHWKVDRYHCDFSNEDEEVLEGLQPHQNLKSLTIEGYKGKKFPSWMLTGRDARDGLSLFDNLIEITLSFCNECEEVPTLGHLPCLRVLEINGNDNDAKELTTATCEVFPCLEELIIESCAKLTSAPCHFPSLKKLEISEICSKAFENISSKLTTLTSLVIEQRVTTCLFARAVIAE
uniref:Uncharacterized protein n=1 Tax=Fagus sylvatica TaxID=28930 RepID=A0A2N9G0K8_FAGSY